MIEGRTLCNDVSFVNTTVGNIRAFTDAGKQVYIRAAESVVLRQAVFRPDNDARAVGPGLPAQCADRNGFFRGCTADTACVDVDNSFTPAKFIDYFRGTTCRCPSTRPWVSNVSAGGCTATTCAANNIPQVRHVTFDQPGCLDKQEWQLNIAGACPGDKSGMEVFVGGERCQVVYSSSEELRCTVIPVMGAKVVLNVTNTK